MKKSQILLAFLLAFNGLSLAVADTILGVYAGVSYWQHDLADSIDSELTDRKNHEKGNVLYVALEHPVPFIPNIKLQQNNIEGQQRGDAQITGVGGVVHNIRAVSTTDLSHTDITLYYELLDNWLNLDLGFSVKRFDGFAYHLGQAEQTVSQRITLDDWEPLLYGKGQFDLPFTGFSVYGSIQGSSAVTDVEVGLNYESKMGLGGVIGYRNLDLDITKNNGLRVDNNAGGLFVGVNFHF